MVRAFQRDFEANGPSVARIVRTTLAGWKRHKNHPDPRVRRRLAWSVKDIATTYAAVIWATAKYYRGTPHVHAEMSQILRDLYGEFGLKARVAAMFGGPYVLRRLRQEQQRLDDGWTYEPPTFYETNFDRGILAAHDRSVRPEPCRYVDPPTQTAPTPPVRLPTSALAG